VNETLNRIARGRTVVSVTHRLATVADYERICVFGEGRLVEQGTFAELRAAGGAFAELWEKQSGFTVGDDGAAGVKSDWLRRVPLFAAVPEDILGQLADEFVSEQFDKGRDVIVRGDVADRFYITVRGKVEVLAPNAVGTTERIAVLQDGDHFGEVALLRNIPRIATVRTLESSTFLTLHKKKFGQLLRRQPALREAMEAVHARRETLRAASKA
jgi:ATP-binding cassette subfamily B protein